MNNFNTTKIGKFIKIFNNYNKEFHINCNAIIFSNLIDNSYIFNSKKNSNYTIDFMIHNDVIKTFIYNLTNEIKNKYNLKYYDVLYNNNILKTKVKIKNGKFITKIFKNTKEISIFDIENEYKKNVHITLTCNIFIKNNNYTIKFSVKTININ